MPYTSPSSVLFDYLGRQIAVSSSQIIVNGHQPAIPVAGRDYNDKAHIVRTNVHSELVTVGNEASTTRFGQNRVVNPYKLFESLHKYGFETLDYGSRSVGNVNENYVVPILSESSVRLFCGSGSNDKITFRTKEWFRYQPGHEQVIKITAVVDQQGKDNQIITFGYGDDYDGLFWCISGSTWGTLRRTSTAGIVREFFTSASQFGHDKLDGSGPSEQNISYLFGNIYEIRFQWLGYGFVDHFMNGEFCNSQSFFNISTRPYIRTATLPIQFEIKNTAAQTTTSSIKFTCVSVESDGGSKPPSYTFTAFNATDVTTNNTVSGTSCLLIRPGTTFRGSENRVITIPKHIDFSCDSGKTSFKIISNPTLLSTPTWQSASINNSSVEYSTSSVIWAGGETLLYKLLPSTTDSDHEDLEYLFDNSSRKLKLDAFGNTSDILLISARAEVGASTLARANISWAETR
jgi:hypothetical protein